MWSGTVTCSLPGKHTTLFGCCGPSCPAAALLGLYFCSGAIPHSQSVSGLVRADRPVVWRIDCLSASSPTCKNSAYTPIYITGIGLHECNGLWVSRKWWAMMPRVWCCCCCSRKIGKPAICSLEVIILKFTGEEAVRASHRDRLTNGLTGSRVRVTVCLSDRLADWLTASQETSRINQSRLTVWLKASRKKRKKKKLQADGEKWVLWASPGKSK